MKNHLMITFLYAISAFQLVSCNGLFKNMNSNKQSYILRHVLFHSYGSNVAAIQQSPLRVAVIDQDAHTHFLRVDRNGTFTVDDAIGDYDLRIRLNKLEDIEPNSIRNRSSHISLFTNRGLPLSSFEIDGVGKISEMYPE